MVGSAHLQLEALGDAEVPQERQRDRSQRVDLANRQKGCHGSGGERKTGVVKTHREALVLIGQAVQIDGYASLAEWREAQQRLNKITNAMSLFTEVRRGSEAGKRLMKGPGHNRG